MISAEMRKLSGSSQNRRHDIILATKAGNRWNDDKDGWHWDASKGYIKEAVKTACAG